MDGSVYTIFGFAPGVSSWITRFVFASLTRRDDPCHSAPGSSSGASGAEVLTTGLDRTLFRC